MTEKSGSFLPDIAVVEREELEEIEKTAAKCREEVDELRRTCRREVASIPDQLQEERRGLIARVRAADERKAEDLAEHAQCDVERLDAIAERLSDEISAMILDAIMPHTICGHAQEGAS